MVSVGRAFAVLAFAALAGAAATDGQGSGSVLTLAAEVATAGNAGWESLTIPGGPGQGGGVYIAAANFWDGKSRDMKAKSAVYAVRRRGGGSVALELERTQGVYGKGAHGWDAFTGVKLAPAPPRVPLHAPDIPPEAAPKTTLSTLLLAPPRPRAGRTSEAGQLARHSAQPSLLATAPVTAPSHLPPLRCRCTHAAATTAYPPGPRRPAARAAQLLRLWVRPWSVGHPPTHPPTHRTRTPTNPAGAAMATPWAPVLRAPSVAACTPMSEAQRVAPRTLIYIPTRLSAGASRQN